MKTATNTLAKLKIASNLITEAMIEEELEQDWQEYIRLEREKMNSPHTKPCTDIGINGSKDSLDHSVSPQRVSGNREDKSADDDIEEETEIMY
jgi:hypothetical protein